MKDTSIVRRAALAALVLLALLGLLATRGYDATRLGQALLARARDATGLRLEAEGARFRPLRGLELLGVHAASSFPGGRYDVTLREIRFEHRLGSVLSGRLDVHRLVLDEPRIVLTVGGQARNAPARPPSGPSSPPPEGDPETSSKGEASSPQPLGSERFAFSLSEIRIDDASFTLRDRTEAPAPFGFEGLALDLRSVRFDRGALTLLHGIAGDGTVALRAIRFARTEATAIEARAAVDGGRYALSELSFETGGAVFEDSGLELDFNSIPFRYTLELRGRGELPDILGGRATLRLEAAGFGTSSRNVSGSGVLELAAGRLPDAPWARALEAAADAELVGRGYAPARAVFRVDASQIVFEPFRLDASPYAIEVEGAVGLEGPIQLRVAVAEDGSPARRFRLSGTFAAPELEEEP